MTPGPDDAATAVDGWVGLGAAIRDRRRAKGLTMVALARSAGLSQPFLSQVENDRARPSLLSLHRLADALGTTPQALFGTAAARRGADGHAHHGDDPGVGPAPYSGLCVTRAGEAPNVGEHSRAVDSVCHVLIGGAAPLRMLEFDGLPREFLGHFRHEGFEATYVLSGVVELEVGGEVVRLRTGDSASYPADLPHRLRTVGRTRARVLLVETPIGGAALHGPDHGPG